MNRRSYFFGFQSAQGEKWHVHSQTANVWFFIQPACNTSECVQNGGFETTEAEHLSFLTPTPGPYWVGVSVLDEPDAGLPEVLLQHDICHDDILEHGEGCDPKRDATPDPLCVECKRVLETPSHGIEPNDSPLDANIIPLSGSNMFVVNKTVGQLESRDAGYGNVIGLNPYDFFGLEATDYKKTVYAVLTWQAASCDTTAYLAAVDYNDNWFEAGDAVPHNCQTCSTGLTPSSAGNCTKYLVFPYDPQNTQPNLSPYFIRVAASQRSKITYTLTLSLQIPGDAGG